MSDLKLYNTLSREKEVFQPEDENNVRMYVCGPTVYDFAHIGNARPVIVFDVLYRLLRHLYGEDKVTYVRNITDVDDKINARALRDYPDLPLNEAIRNVTEKTANQFHADVKSLGCLEPNHEPRATEHIEGMAQMIQTLIDKGHAYIAKGEQGREVLFRVGSMENYGALSNRKGKLDEQVDGARVAVESHKENAGDFVLWKESGENEPGWSGTFNDEAIHGRPGWHIECSVMAKHHLGETFDIHGGGLDLIFPHHENEIAQSCCAHDTKNMANYWMHNGYLQVEGKKMSKSDGNFVTIHDLLHTENFGGRKWPGEVLRLAMLMTHYREPIDFSVKRLEEAELELRDWSLALIHLLEWEGYVVNSNLVSEVPNLVPSEEIIAAINDDLNTSSAIAVLRKQRKRLTMALEQNKSNPEAINAAAQFFADAKLLGLLSLQSSLIWSNGLHPDEEILKNNYNDLISLRTASLNNDMIGVVNSTKILQEAGFIVHEKAPFCWRISKGEEISETEIDKLISERLSYFADKNFAEADRIRDELASQGIQLKDSKDSETGERVTTWEVKR